GPPRWRSSGSTSAPPAAAMREWGAHRGGAAAAPGKRGASATALRLLRDLIVQRTGVFFADAKLDMLEERLDEVVAARGVPSLLDYYYLLRYDPGAEAAWGELMDRLAVPETYFWRQAEQIEALAGVVLPRLVEARGGRPVRIWSAACCTGEEPLSIAMALDEGGWLDRAPVEIVGSDASAALVARARAGVYGERSLRNLSPERRARYFTPKGAGWRIDPALHARVRWGVANLLDEEEAGPLARADVVFCRNVFIYFSDDAIRKVARMLAARMPADGWLFLGASESLMRLGSDFHMDEVGPAFAYTRGPGAGPAPGRS
ncbi:MAG TPA: protein-glutamate O-methyltransferase CheR, partial [Longimicrobium sp.]|nr:protein-glutamate O-methyltransferase CheR [Longimicrobium sp.]